MSSCADCGYHSAGPCDEHKKNLCSRCLMATPSKFTLTLGDEDGNGGKTHKPGPSLQEGGGSEPKTSFHRSSHPSLRRTGLMGQATSSTLASAAGVTGTYGEMFPCVIDGHDHDAHVHRTGRGFARYVCPEAPDGLGMGELRASIAYGKVKSRRSGLSKAEAAIWHDRLKFEAGVLKPRPVMIPMPEPQPRSSATRRVAEGWKLLVGLRDQEAWGGLPFAFAREFVMAWCDVTDQQAKRGVQALEKCGALVRVDAPKRGTRKPILYVPPGRQMGGAVPATEAVEVAA